MDWTTTKKLEEKLIQIDREEDLGRYLENSESIFPYQSFANYFVSLEKVKKLTTASLVHASGIERSYCYQILNGTRSNPGRDKILRLCIAAKLSLKETDRALRAADEAALYVRNKRDAIIIFSLEQHHSVEDTNLLLDQFSEKPLE